MPLRVFSEAFYMPYYMQPALKSVKKAMQLAKIDDFILKFGIAYVMI